MTSSVASAASHKNIAVIITLGQHLYDTYTSATLYLSEDGELLVTNIEPWNKFTNIKSYDPAGIDEISVDFDANLPYEVYNLNGIKVGNSIEGLSSGIFIVRQGKTVKKISVK